MRRDDPLTITDPQRLRALAHPLRNRLLDLLRTKSEATATECAEFTGESVASCSFHLRMLAKYGFIEASERRGKERPWRLVTRSFTASADVRTPGSVEALRELALLELDQESRRLREWIGRMTTGEPDEWTEASEFHRATFWATPAEMAEVGTALRQLTDRFNGRWQDASSRPADARIVRLFGATAVEPIVEDDRAHEPDAGSHD